MPGTDALLTMNDLHASAIANVQLPLPPTKRLAVVTFMAGGLNVYGALGLQERDAHVIRTAGGIVTDDELFSLAISQRLLGTREIILLHQTDRVRQSLARIKASPIILVKDSIRGFVYDVDGGRLREVR